MAAATTCSATIANTTSAGCAWGTGRHTDQSITNVPGMLLFNNILLESTLLR
jgi:hypothetical protein